MIFVILDVTLTLLWRILMPLIETVSHASVVLSSGVCVQKLVFQSSLRTQTNYGS